MKEKYFPEKIHFKVILTLAGKILDDNLELVTYH